MSVDFHGVDLPDPTPLCTNAWCRRRIEPEDSCFEVDGYGKVCDQCAALDRTGDNAVRQSRPKKYDDIATFLDADD